MAECCRTPKCILALVVCVIDANADTPVSRSQGPSGASARQLAKKAKAAPIKAVEVDADGSSYNPDPVHHQDTVAAAVADEVAKQLRAELAVRMLRMAWSLGNALANSSLLSCRQSCEWCI